MVVHIRILQNESKLWRFLGFLSSIVGLVCFALSSSFKQIFGEWSFFAILLYIIVGLFICGLVLFAKKIQVSRSFIVKSHVGLLVLMLTSFYSFFYDKAVKGKPDALSTISYAAFAFMSLCFSRKLELGFEVGLFNFFLGCLTVQLMKINLVLAFVAAFFCYSLIIFRCYLDSQLEIEATSTEDRLTVRIDSANGEIQPSPSIGEFTGESIFGDNHYQKSEEEKNLSIFYIEETTDQDNAISQNNVVNDRKQSFPTETESNPQYPQLRRRRRTKCQTEEDISSGSVEEKSPSLQACDLCRRPVLPSKDIYMYRGEAFCSLECREQQMIERETETEQDSISFTSFPSFFNFLSVLAKEN